MTRCVCTSFFLAPQLPQSRPMLRVGATRVSVCAIARKVADIRHYPAGTDKAAARTIRAKEKKIARQERQKRRDTPSGYGDRPGAGIFPYGSPERTQAEREAYHSRIPEFQRQAALNFAGMLAGGQADRLLHTLRARWLDRLEKARDKKTPVLTEDVASLYESLIDEIFLCDSLYYCDNPKPRIADAQYDELVMHLLELERCFPELICPRSPSQNVGHGAAARATKLALDNEVSSEEVCARGSYAATVSLTTKLFHQYKHKALMLSLDNAYTHSDLDAFFTRAQNAGSALSAEMKIDGVALSLEYRHRELYLAATRGTGRIGDDITENVREALLSSGVVEKIEDDGAPDWLVVRGEVYITPSDFNSINSTLSRPLSNPRNAAAGALKHKDPSEARARKLRFVAYDCLVGNLADAEVADQNEKRIEDQLVARNMWPTQEETLSMLAKWGFGRMPRSNVCTSLGDVDAFAIRIEEERANLGVEVDGIVLKFNESEAREAAGHTARAPRGAIAYKFAAQARITRINDVVMQVSRNGVITPVAILEPVRVGGAVLSRATLHNFDEVKRLGVAVGDYVRVERGGDVIPKVLQVDSPSKSPHREVITAPEKCPSCGGEVASKRARGGGMLVGCLNSRECNGQTLGRLIHFASREAMDIRGLGKKTAEKLVFAGLVTIPADLFRMTLDDILSLEGFAEKSSATLYESVQEAANSRSFERLIFGLGLPTVGRSSARMLALKLKSIDSLLELSRDPDGRQMLLSIPNIAEKSAEAIYDHLTQETTQWELKAIRSVVDFRRIAEEDAAESVASEVETISGNCFVFTGKFMTMSRPKAMKWIKEHGGTVTSSVSKKTDFVVTGLEPGSKLFKGQRLGIKIVPEEEFFTLFEISEDDAAVMLEKK